MITVVSLPIVAFVAALGNQTALAATYIPARAASEGPARSDCYHNYALMLKGESKRGFDACRRLAEQGDRRAQALLGTMYWDGLGTQKNTPKAIYWMTQAAQRGDIMSMQFLGSIYLPAENADVASAASARGLQSDPVQAYMWFSLAIARTDTFG